ncbi:MAG: glycosyltransferase [Pseudomonadota bacterium]
MNASTDTPRQSEAPKRDAALRVAVVIPAWNAASTVARAVGSALAQTEPCRVVLVDDASSDDTAARAEATAAAMGAEDRLTVIRAPRNAGPAAARNAAIDAASEDWIALLDADDAMEPGRLAALLDAAGDGWDFVADDLYRVAEGDLDGPRRRLIAEADFEPHALDFEAFVLGNLHGARGRRGELGFLKPLMRRSFLEDHGLRYDAGVRLGEDYDFYARALAAGARMKVVNPFGYFAVERADSISSKHGAADLAAVMKADRALLARTDLAEAERRAVRRHLGPIRREWAWLSLIDAVKARAPLKALGCFAGPPDVGLSLAARLGEQAVLRARRRFAPGGGPAR